MLRGTGGGMSNWVIIAAFPLTQITLVGLGWCKSLFWALPGVWSLMAVRESGLEGFCDLCDDVRWVRDYQVRNLWRRSALSAYCTFNFEHIWLCYIYLVGWDGWVRGVIVRVSVCKGGPSNVRSGSVVSVVYTGSLVQSEECRVVRLE